MNYLHMLYVFLPAIAAGVVQTTTGFGAGIVIMMFLPIFLPVLTASGLSTLISIFLNIMVAWRYRRHIDIKILVVPAIVYTVVSGVTIHYAPTLNVGGLKAYFGLFLIVVAIYFLAFAKRIHLKANPLTAAVCSTISGVVSGLFGIGGPPMVLYFLAATGDDKDKYFAATQVFFTATSLYNTALRFANGIITVELLPLVIPGVLGIFLGKLAGQRITDRINIDQLKIVIYSFLAFSGFVTFITNI